MDEKFRKAGLASRLVSGVILAAAVITCWVLGGKFIAGLIAVASLAGMGEFLFLFQKQGCHAMKAFGLALCAVFLAACAFMPAIPASVLISAAFLLCALYGLFDWSREKGLDPLRKAAVVMCGILYMPALLAPVMQFSRWEQLLIVLVPVVSDVAAYFAGVTFGSHSIWKSVSPKKSIEGSIAGFAASTAAACALGAATGTAGMAAFAALGAAMAVMAQLGDFFESALKRAVDVKDSSRLIPGHGGVLDRLDSIVFCAGTYTAAAALHPFFG